MSSALFQEYDNTLAQIAKLDNQGKETSHLMEKVDDTNFLNKIRPVLVEEIKKMDDESIKIIKRNFGKMTTFRKMHVNRIYKIIFDEMGL